MPGLPRESGLSRRPPGASRLRERWDPSTRRGLGAHITIRYPFLSPAQLRDDDLGRLAAAVASVPVFAYTLAQVSRSPTTVFLDPEPVAPFVALRVAIEGAFGSRLPVDRFPRYVPHLSVARNVRREADEVLAELHASMPSEPIPCRCVELVLLDRHGGPWMVSARMPLARDA
jgi:2'-5' RNA ligase